MSDQCQHCVVRGDIAECEATDCGFHEGWAHQHWRTRALAAERKAAVAEALLGCIEPVTDLLRTQYERANSKTDAHYAAGLYGSTVTALAYLANPTELMRLVPETRPIIESALAQRGVGLEELP